MFRILFSPKWFYGKDILIDIFSVLVLSLIAMFSIKYYKMDKSNKKYLWFAWSFILLAGSFVAKILTNFTIYYHTVNTKTIGLFTFTYNTVSVSNILFVSGFFMYIFFTLIGIIGLYLIYNKVPKSSIFILLFLAAVITYFSSHDYFVFHLTSFMLLLIISLKYLEHYNNNEKRVSKILMISFFIITFSQFLFIFIGISEAFYVAAEIIQLTGYLLLLRTFIGVIKNGKKK